MNKRVWIPVLIILISAQLLAVNLTASGSPDSGGQNTATELGTDRNEASQDASSQNTAHLIWDVPYLSQLPDYPDACESVSAVMILNYLGIRITVSRFVDRYLDCGEIPDLKNHTGDNPDSVYMGNPREDDAWGCYPSVIVNSLKRILNENQYTISSESGKSLTELCHTYIDRDIPVLIWATVNMKNSDQPKFQSYWFTEDNEFVTYNNCLHCLVLVGYDENYYYFTDPMDGGAKERETNPLTSVDFTEKDSSETAEGRRSTVDPFDEASVNELLYPQYRTGEAVTRAIGKLGASAQTKGCPEPAVSSIETAFDISRDTNIIAYPKDEVRTAYRIQGKRSLAVKATSHNDDSADTPSDFTSSETK